MHRTCTCDTRGRKFLRLWGCFDEMHRMDRLDKVSKAWTRASHHVAARVWLLISGAWEGSPHPNGAASWLHLSAGLAGVAGCSAVLSVQWALGRSGIVSQSLLCVGGGARRHSAVWLPCGGAASGANCGYIVRHARRASQHTAQCPSRVHHATSDQDSVL